MLHNNKENVILSLFNGHFIFEIPLFQRNYKWNKDHVQDLLGDFDDIIDQQKDVHFFGAMIFFQQAASSDKPVINEIIDGQQRLTTLFLFLCAATYSLRQNDTAKASNYFKNLLTNQQAEGPNSKLHPSKDDRKQLNWIFDNILTKSFIEELKPAKYNRLSEDPSSKADGKLRDTYNRFKVFFNSQIANIDNSKEKAKKVIELVDLIFGSCTVVELHVVDRQKGPEIFDKLNASQEAMTVGELIKNSMFARLDDHSLQQTIDMHNTHWLPFENSFNDPKHLDNYFFPFGLIKDPNLKKNDTYRRLSQMWKHVDNIPDVMNQLNEYKNAYLCLTTNNLTQYDKDIMDCIRRHRDAKMPSSALPFFMQLLHQIEIMEDFQDEAIKILNCLETFFVRRASCNIEPTGLHAVFKRLWPDLQQRGITAKNVFDYLNGAKTVTVPDDEMFKEHIKTNKIAGKNIDKFLLEQYDRSLKGEIPKNTALTVEHILPQNFTNWSNKFTKEEHEKYVDTFANLLLLTQSLNSSVQNKNFDDKKAAIEANAMMKSTRIFF